MVKHRRDHAVAFLQHNGGEIFRIPCGIIHIERRKFAFRIMLFMFRFTQEFPGDDACEQRRCSFIIFHIQPAFQKRTSGRATCAYSRYAISVGARSRETAETVLLYPMSYSV